MTLTVDWDGGDGYVKTDHPDSVWIGDDNVFLIFENAPNRFINRDRMVYVRHDSAEPKSLKSVIGDSDDESPPLKTIPLGPTGLLLE